MCRYCWILDLRKIIYLRIIWEDLKHHDFIFVHLLMFLMHILLKVKTAVVLTPVLLFNSSDSLFEVLQIPDLAPLEICIGEFP